MSVLSTLSNTRAEYPLARKIILKLHNLKLLGKGVEFCWVPSHDGIYGNERADKLASDAAKQPESLIPIDFRDFQPFDSQHESSLNPEMATVASKTKAN